MNKYGLLRLIRLIQINPDLSGKVGHEVHYSPFWSNVIFYHFSAFSWNYHAENIKMFFLRQIRWCFYGNEIALERFNSQIN